ncbi:MAG: polysaccharide biosynthesis protein [Geodermatophilaceae bacterium]|nr:polysaccharide biosynthesis protein [Geodermatophilaceae bacterium]
MILRLYQGRYAVGSADELTALAIAIAGASISLFAVSALAPNRLVPLSVPFIGAVIAFVLMLGLRLALRRTHEGAVRPRLGEPTLIFGAGDAGNQLIRSMLQDAQSPFLPVGLLDDDPAKRHSRIYRVRMLGNRHAIGAAAARTGATTLVVAIPTADASLVRDVSALAGEAGLSVKVLPGIVDLLSPRIGIRDVRDIDLADVLGRHQIDTDLGAMADYLTNKRVLITGAGGSIGAELCRQVQLFGPAELILLDRDESALHAVQLSLYGRSEMGSGDVVLADIRDAEAVSRIFARKRPQVVFHAAALKHVNMLERFPEEAWKTNVLGTRNVLDAATAVEVECFINISTDKAANPANVLGRSKRVAERLTAQYARDNGGAFLSVRFGNVLGSRGSVLTTFAAQIARGGPVTVTDPGVTRFFMTIEEAVQLVIQGGALGQRGETLVLDMGEPILIADVARQLIAMSHRPVALVFTGLRPGEKLHEDLFDKTEHGSRPHHPLISHVRVPQLKDRYLEAEDWSALVGSSEINLPMANRTEAHSP